MAAAIIQNSAVAAAANGNNQNKTSRRRPQKHSIAQRTHTHVDKRECFGVKSLGVTCELPTSAAQKVTREQCS